MINILGDSSYDSSFSVLRSDNIPFLKLKEKIGMVHYHLKNSNGKEEELG